MSDRKKRLAKFIYFIGHNRTGKTTTAQRMVSAYRRDNPTNEIWAFDPQGKFTDIKGVKRITNNENWVFFLEKKDILIILDDYKLLMPEDTTDKDFNRMMSLRDENGIDIMLICHHPKQILEKLSYYVTEYFLYFTIMSDDWNGLDRKLAHGNRVLKIVENVTRYVNDNGKWEGEPVEPPPGTPHTFRYAIWDNVKATVKYVSFKYKGRIIDDSFTYEGDSGKKAWEHNEGAEFQ